MTRHGKFIDVSAQGLHLVFHLARAGWLRWSDELPTAPARPGKGPLALRLRLDDGSGFNLTEAGTQRKLAVHVVTDPQSIAMVATLGPEPLDPTFDRAALDALLAHAGRAQLKGVLKDQRVIAGIGNAYSDEILHAARMSPFKPASSLTDEERDTLLAAIKGELKDQRVIAGIGNAYSDEILHAARMSPFKPASSLTDEERDTLLAAIKGELTGAVSRAEGLAAKDLKGEKKSGMRVHGKAGQACPVCGDTVAEVSFADSSLQYCPTCQTGGKKLADRRMSRLLR